MKTVLSISEIVSSKGVGPDTYEIFASAEAAYDENKSLLMVDLDSFVEKVDSRSHTERLQKDGLPQKQTVQESVSMDEAVPAAKEVFKAWVKKVRRTIPDLISA